MIQARDDEVILRLEGITKVYSGTVAVKQVKLENLPKSELKVIMVSPSPPVFCSNHV